MSDAIKHECGIAAIRLLKPYSYYVEKYGTPVYGLNKLHLLMEKQHNRGQDGVGVAAVKLDVPAGDRFISRYRSNSTQPIKDVFQKIFSKFELIQQSNPDLLKDPEWLKKNVSFTGELLLGHLRYGTHGNNNIEACHPFLRQNNWKTRNLILAGNFNMTNVDDLFQQLVEIGQHPKEKSDTVTVLEKVGHFLDDEIENLYIKHKQSGASKKEATEMIADTIDIKRILERSAKDFDGGYVLAGLLGHGDSFVLRDPGGIRPAFYYRDEEIVVVASERPAIQTAFNLKYDQIQEIKPGHALIIRKNGDVSEELCREPIKKAAKCSFERIYFSRGNDKDIYQERKNLGKLITPKILEAIDYDIEHAVFSFIPNTAETSFYGLIDGLNEYSSKIQAKKIKALGNNFDDQSLEKILSIKPRLEKMIVKDAKLRTFITNDSNRDDLVAHVYDITYGQIKRGVDTLVLIDDSIVRGTTLKQSILRIVDRLGPKKVVIVSSAPQIRFPDCYGIDMSKLKDFIAFRAAIELLEDQNKEHVIEEVYHACKEQLSLPIEKVKNVVNRIFEPFTDEDISNKIAQMLRPKDMKAELNIIYQNIDDLHKACPNHTGDWYFTGDFPTSGGNKVVCKSFINFYEKSDARAY